MNTPLVVALLIGIVACLVMTIRSIRRLPGRSGVILYGLLGMALVAVLNLHLISSIGAPS